MLFKYCFILTAFQGKHNKKQDCEGLNDLTNENTPTELRTQIYITLNSNLFAPKYNNMKSGFEFRTCYLMIYLLNNAKKGTNVYIPIKTL